MARLRRWLFPSCPRFDERQEAQLSGDVRNAQQVLLSSTRIVAAKAKQSVDEARRQTEQVRAHVAGRQAEEDAALRTAMGVMNLISRGRPE